MSLCFPTNHQMWFCFVLLYPFSITVFCYFCLAISISLVNFCCFPHFIIGKNEYGFFLLAIQHYLAIFYSGFLFRCVFSVNYARFSHHINPKQQMSFYTSNDRFYLKTYRFIFFFVFDPFQLSLSLSSNCKKILSFFF